MRLVQAVGLILILGAPGACNRKLEHSNRSDGDSTRCPGLAADVASVPGDSADGDERCLLAERAIKALAPADPARGLSPADTSQIIHISVTPLTVVSEEGSAANEPTWHVTLTLRNKSYDAEAIINRRTDSLTINRIHKPLGQ